MPRWVDREVRLHLNRLLHPEDRPQIAVRQVPASDRRTLESDAQTLRRGVQRHVRAIEAHRIA